MSNGVFNFNFLALLLSEILVGAHFELRSSIHAGLTEHSLYNRFALKNLPKCGFLGILGGGAKIFGGNPLGMQ